MYSTKLVLLLLFWISCTGAQDSNITFIQHPISNTFCEGDNGVLSCVVEDSTTSDSANTTGWFMVDTSPVLIQPNINPKFIINNTRNGDVVTSILIIQNLSSSDNGDEYFCSPLFGTRSNSGIISVIASSATAPNITEVKPINNTTFCVSWEILDINYTYNHTIIFTNLHDDMGSVTVPGSTNSSIITGLNGIDSYTVIVASTCGMMMSAPRTVYGPPAPIMNITFPADRITNESFCVQWNEVMDFFPVRYIVSWNGEDGNNGTATVNRPSHTVDKLTANTSYNVTVVAINTCCGAGPISNIVMVMTNNKPPTLPPPTTTTAATSVTITPSNTIGNSTSGGGNGSPGAIIGGVVGGVVAVIVVVIIIIVVYMFFCRNKDLSDGDRQELKSPTTGTGGSHTASVKPSANVPHQTAASGEEYAVTSKVTTTTKPQQQPTQEYAMVDKSKKHAAANQGITYADLQELPASGNKPPTNQGPTSTYAMVA